MKTKLRHFTVFCAAALISCPIFGQSVELRILSDSEFGNLPFKRVSSNGRYAVASFANSVPTGYVYDFTTDEVKTVEGPEGAIELNVPKRLCTIEDISNDGIICGQFLSPDAIVRYTNSDGSPQLDEEGNQLCSSAVVPGVYRNGAWMGLEIHDDQMPVMGGNCDGGAAAITADGKYVAGLIRIKVGEGETGLRFATVVWDAVTGKIIREYDGCTERSGGRAWDMSDDTSLIVGWTETLAEGRGPALWQDGEYLRVAPGGNGESASANGKYAIGSAQSDKAYSFVWEKEKGVTLYPSPEGVAAWPTCVSDKGLVVGYTQPVGMGRRPRMPFMLTQDGVYHNMMDYLKEKYNFEFPEELLPSQFDGTPNNTANDYLYTPMSMSADGSVICGFTSLSEPWIMKLTETSGIRLAVEGESLRIFSDIAIKRVMASTPAGQLTFDKCVSGEECFVSSLDQGIHILQLTLLDGRVATRKVVIR